LYPIVYVEVVKTSIPIVGQRIADFVLYLKKNNYISLDKLHLVGHSLGAHLAGRVGHALQKHPDGGKVSRITGLDPAGPLFDVMKFHRKLVKDDADFVDVYHTAMGPMNYGDFSKDGHVDFYRKLFLSARNVLKLMFN
jgi:pimeloyl-ACP methyl ester carboxylesterase